ncbi:MAG: hypothetical protein RMJ19_03060 [Gemmatales bacterium]|nr:hypothetical protein [Gemmatales bacterium]MCS7159428.1 hypothetical protein [Gemmatales bacterium]MDW8174627.1 hypothetical protein [Gemmatales bacterium]MDW8223611.1 hypothetical protein [Gemmatales bacterium]
MPMVLATPKESRSFVPHEVDLETLQTRLEAALGSYVREVRLIRHNGGIILQGRASSFYGKQLAQTVLMRLCDLPVIANDMEVQ